MAMNTNHLLPGHGTFASPPVASRVNVDHLLAGVDKDPELATELIDMFQEDLLSMLANLQTAIAEEDLEVVNRLAHSLKIPMGLFGATDARDQSHKLELATVESEATSTSVLEEMFSGLRAELNEVSEDLQRVQFAKP